MNKNKRIIFGIVALIILVALILILSFNKKESAKLGELVETFPETDIVQESEEEFVIPEGIDEIGRQLLLREQEVKKIISESKIAAPGANPVTKEGDIINREGNLIVNTVGPSDALAPATSEPVNPNSLAEEVIKLEVVLGAFSPSEFRVKAGAPVSISLTGKDHTIHALEFIDPSLSAINLTVSSGETRVMTFKAPTVKGEYVFKCPVGGDKVGHVVRGEVGKMIVE